MTVQTHNFEADTGKILNIVINSLYSDRDIFLRELLVECFGCDTQRRKVSRPDPTATPQ